MKRIVCLIYFIFSLSLLQSIDITGVFSSKNILIGERVECKITLKNEAASDVLWSEMKTDASQIEIIEYKSENIKNDKLIQIIFTSFEPGFIKDFSFYLFLNNKKGSINEYVTKKYSITVKSSLTDDEVKTIKESKNPQNIKVKPEKEIEVFKYKFRWIIILLLFIILAVIISMVLYFFIYKKLFRKRPYDNKINDKLTPFERFLIKYNNIEFGINDSRVQIEKKLSDLTEVFKEIIHEEFNIDVPSKTTKEFITILKNNKFDQKMIVEINGIMNNLDMIKFAKSPYSYDEIVDYRQRLYDIALKINEIYNNRIEEELIKNDSNKIR